MNPMVIGFGRKIIRWALKKFLAKAAVDMVLDGLEKGAARTDTEWDDEQVEKIRRAAPIIIESLKNLPL